MLIDRSATARQALRTLIDHQLDMTVVAEAGNGETGLALVRKWTPDVTVIDAAISSPGAAELTSRIMVEQPCPVVVVAAGESAAQHAVTIDALRCGALRAVERPPLVDGVADLVDPTGFTDALRTMAAVRVIRSRAGAAGVRVDDNLPARVAPLRVRHSGQMILAVGASTGGPPALQLLLGPLPADFPYPILVTQHITPGFTEAFANWLGRILALDVAVARDAEQLRPGTVRIAPDGQHIGVAADGIRIRLSDDPPANGHRPSVDWMLSCLAAVAGPRVTAIQLTGMGGDGAAGCAAVEAAGGQVLVQDPRTAVVPSMPQQALARCRNAASLPIPGISATLIQSFRARPDGGNT